MLETRGFFGLAGGTDNSMEVINIYCSQGQPLAVFLSLVTLARIYCLTPILPVKLKWKVEMESPQCPSLMQKKFNRMYANQELSTIIAVFAGRVMIL